MLKQDYYNDFFAFGDTLEAVTADSGYCTEKNLLYLKENDIRSYIKLQDYEKRKTRAYKEDIGKYYNMTYAAFEDEHYYICHDGRQLRHIQTESKEQRPIWEKGGIIYALPSSVFSFLLLGRLLDSDNIIKWIFEDFIKIYKNVRL